MTLVFLLLCFIIILYTYFHMSKKYFNKIININDLILILTSAAVAVWRNDKHSQALPYYICKILYLSDCKATARIYTFQMNMWQVAWMAPIVLTYCRRFSHFLYEIFMWYLSNCYDCKCVYLSDRDICKCIPALSAFQVLRYMWTFFTDEQIRSCSEVFEAPIKIAWRIRRNIELDRH